MKMASLMLAVFAPVTLSAAVLIENGESKAPSRLNTDVPRASSYPNAKNLRQSRPVAVGTTVGGTPGLVGLQMEFTVRPHLSALAAFGGGEGFRSFTFQVRRVYEGTTIVPYLAGGFSRWYSSVHERVQQTNPAFLKDSFLSEKGKRTGEFAENLVFPSAGLQYVQLRGPYVGVSLFAEVSALLDLNRFVVVPTGGVGASYYF